jgi:hypothetical protein
VKPHSKETRGGSPAPASPRRVAAAEKHAEALRLRIAGGSFSQIARQLGYASKGQAYKAVMAGLERWGVEPAEELRTLELARLDELTLGLWPKAMKGDAHAVDVCLRISARRAKLLGLDAPAEHRVQGEVDHWHHDVAWLDEQIDRLLARGLEGVAAAREGEAPVETGGAAGPADPSG